MALKTFFCVRCGGEKKSLIDGKCPDCYLEDNPVHVPVKVELKVCPKCNAIKWQDSWIHSKNDLKLFFEQLITGKIKLPENAKLEKMSFDDKGILGIEVNIEGNKLIVYREVECKVDKFACPDCSRQRLFWQLKIQLRDLDQENIDRLVKKLNKMKKEVNKIEPVRRGLDIYFFSLATGKRIAMELKNKHNLRMKRTFEQCGYEHALNRPKYREVTLLEGREPQEV